MFVAEFVNKQSLSPYLSAKFFIFEFLSQFVQDSHIVAKMIRLNKTIPVSKLVTDWKTWLSMHSFLHSHSSREVSILSQSQPLSSMKYGTWFLDQQDTRLKQIRAQS